MATRSAIDDIPEAPPLSSIPNSDIGSTVSTASKRSRRRNKKQNTGKNAKALAQQEQLRQQQMFFNQQQQQQAMAPPPKKKDAISLRLDINLEAEVSLRVKVHGDVTLALLYVPSLLISRADDVLKNTHGRLRSFERGLMLWSN